MAELTNKLNKILIGLAHKLTKNKLDYEDCVQEGLRKILMLESNQTTGYYVIHAKGAMQRFLEKERLKGCVPYSNTTYTYKTGNIDPPKFTALEDVNEG